MEDDRLKVIKSEDLYQKPTEVYANLFDYLGLPAFTMEKLTKSNVLSVSGARSLQPATSARLRERFAEDSERVRSMLGWDTGWH